LAEAWQKVLDEDLVAARRIHEAGLRVEFEPAAMTASPLDLTPPQMAAFLRRQYLFARLYTPSWWVIALATSTIATFAFWGSVGLAGWAAANGSPWGWLAAAIGGVLYAMNVARGRLRRGLAGVYFPELRGNLRAASRFDTWAAPLVGLVHWLAVLASACGRTVQWRDVRYRLHRDGSVQAIERSDAPEPRPQCVPMPTRSPKPGWPPVAPARKAA